MAAAKRPARKAPARKKAPAKKSARTVHLPSAPADEPHPDTSSDVEQSGLLTEVASGDERRALVAMRDHLARKMDFAEPAVVAQIAGRLQAVIARIAELGETDGQSPADQLAQRRAKRRAGDS